MNRKVSRREVAKITRAKIQIDPVRSLWSAVMYQGIENMKRSHARARNPSVAKPARQSARLGWRKEWRWFFGTGTSFELVCEILDLDPVAIRERIEAWPEFREPRIARGRSYLH